MINIQSNGVDTRVNCVTKEVPNEDNYHNGNKSWILKKKLV